MRIQTEDEEKSERYLSVALLNDIDNNNKNIKVFPPLRPSQRLGKLPVFDPNFWTRSNR
jgi:hypothetical protein